MGAADTVLSEDERRAFEDEAVAWLDAHAERTPEPSTATAWGEGDEIALMGAGGDIESEREHIRLAKAWRAQVFDAGFGWLGGPVEYGGAGRHPDLDHVYRSIEARYDVPDQSAWNVTWEMVAPAVLHHGSDELKRRFLRRFYRGELLCSQLLSEPEAGSDLAGLRTRAVRDGDEWVVNGQKVWSSYAHLADIGQLMARTDPDVPKHQGISMFMLPLDSPGVDRRPLKQMNGNAEFNEIFLTDVRVPHTNMVGDPGGGWRAVLTTLMSERRAVGSGSGSTVDPAEVITRLAQHLGRSADPIVRQQLAVLHTDSRLLHWLGMRIAEDVAAGAELGPEGSIMKLLANQRNIRLGRLAGELVGMAMMADTGDWNTYAWGRHLCSAPGLRIAGGTDEIQHNILGERVLGLPREPGRS
ncbi:MAG: acyl-CoA dehydrogenase family protein [Acidimicrobiales bacterium]|nr:acyl-CoA dehydrogenase family protein [Acidimicrobiales bacterium]MCB9393151.1 acyl-CoA dehydrogenase family protein [Acidimicrobiaceae bacterium]